MNAYWDTYATGWGVNDWPDETKFRGWTQYAEHGPGPDFAGAPKTVLELGCGDATELAHFARQGAEVTGIDLAGAHVERARERCEGLDARLFQQSAAEFLTHTTEGFDAVISRFGAVWFDDPRQLFPLIRRRMNPGGVLLFTHGPHGRGLLRPAGHLSGSATGAADRGQAVVLHAPDVRGHAPASRLRSSGGAGVPGPRPRGPGDADGPRVGGAVNRPDLAAELRRRARSDQQARDHLTRTGEPGDLLRIDADNTAWLKAVVAEHGWPGRELVGDQGADDAWLLVQHADRDPGFQHEALELLTGAVEAADAPPRHLAYLTDRVLIAEVAPALRDPVHR